jgi:hypothetical protein
MLLLGILLIAFGLLTLIPALAFSGSGNVMAVVGIVAGILLLIDR